MRITCPTCSTQYEVDENDISFSGQDVQCSECMTIWTQTRNGEATNPRLADDLVDENTPDDDAVEIPDEPDQETETSSDLNYPSEPEEAPVIYDYPDVKDPPQDEEPVVDTIPEPDVIEEKTPEEEPEPVQVSDTEVDDLGPEEDPIWKEIAALAQEASSDVDESSSDETEYSPPKDMPPIQTTPAVPQEQEPAESITDENDRPWEAAAEAEEEGFSDFVWNDPSSVNEPEEAATTESDRANVKNIAEPQFTPLPDTSGEKLEQMDDDLITAALNEQMAIEDALEDAPGPIQRDIEDVPVELGGPRRRTPNVEALKSSVRSKSVTLTKEEEKEKVPARRFRRGLSLILLIFVALLAVYVLTDQITEYLPATGPYLETYASYVDILRANAEVFAANVWDLVLQGVEWVKAKIDG